MASKQPRHTSVGVRPTFLRQSWFNTHISPAVRSLRIQVLRQCTKWRNLQEPPKVAQDRSRKVAILHLLSQFVPVSASLVLVVLNLRTTFIGQVEKTALTALQFASKLLEILIQASIAGVLLSAIRTQLLGPDPLPFGSLTAPYRTMDISYLWSLELWGAITSTGAHWQWRMIVLGLIPAAILLAAVIGPSTAVLMIPRPMYYSGVRQLAMLGSSATVYPRSVDLVDGKL